MHDDPYPSRYYPRFERDPQIATAVADLHDHGPAWRSHSGRLLLFVIAFYLVMALLFFASSSSHAAAPQESAPVAGVQSSCVMTQLALR